MAANASGPQVNGPWLATRTAGISLGERPLDVNVSTITRPVLASYADSTSSRVIGRVTGTSPWK